MKICERHWGMLRAEIDRLGLGHLVATSGEQAHAQLSRQLKDGEAAKTTFDPLMAANNMIWSQALQTAGLAAMAPHEDGSERCPICFLDAAHKAGCKDPDCAWTYEATWIPGPCKAAFDEAKRLGLVGDA